MHKFLVQCHQVQHDIRKRLGDGGHKSGMSIQIKRVSKLCDCVWMLMRSCFQVSSLLRDCSVHKFFSSLKTQKCALRKCNRHCT